MQLKMAGRVVLLLLLVGAVVQLASAVIVHSFDGIIKSPQDKCSYRIITLDNQLQALLIHEPDADKASAALDVNVGSFADPDDIAGLAHFLEHLLFMGTAKYPEENDYSKVICPPLSAHAVVPERARRILERIHCRQEHELLL